MSMDKCCRLTHMDEGQCAVVTGIDSSGGMRRRLMDLGIIEGTQIKCVVKSPFGEPVAYLIRGATIALRAEDSDNIRISI